MNNNTTINKDSVIQLLHPLVFDTNNVQINSKDYIEKIKATEKVELFSPIIDTQLFVKPERKNKKSEKDDLRDGDIVKTKLKTKKKEKSKFRKDDYETLNRVAQYHKYQYKQFRLYKKFVGVITTVDST